jgi:nitrogen fixation protein FixH
MSYFEPAKVPVEAQRKLTGRIVLLCFVGFFGVIFAMNAVLVTAAVTTFGGLETASSYKAGLAFAQEEAASRAQEARHWQVTAELQPQPDGQVRVNVAAQDGAHKPLVGFRATAVLAHPTSRRLDRDVDLQTSGAGRFGGTAVISPGQWDLVIELTRNGERLFRSRQRVQLKAAGRT